MWWLSLSPFILPPSAALAGLFTWRMTRGRRPPDGELVRHFLVALGLLLLASAGIMQLDAVRQRWDPVTKARAAFVAVPLHQALARHFPDEWKALQLAANVSFQEGQSLQAVMAQTRGLYPLLARKHLPAAQGVAVIGYAQALVPVLQSLQSTDPALCVRLAWRHVAGPPFDPGARLAPEVQAAYEAAIARVLAENSKATAGDWKPEVGASLRQADAAWAGIVAAMPPRYANLMAALHTQSVTQFDPAVACEVSAQVIARAAALPPPVARQLLVMLLVGS